MLNTRETLRHNSSSETNDTILVSAQTAGQIGLCTRKLTVVVKGTSIPQN